MGVKNQNDLISRSAAIDAVCKACSIESDYHKCEGYNPNSQWCDEVTALRCVPSAQPEIIRCKECKYGVQDEDERWYCRGFGCQVGEEDGNGFCADAERENNV